MESTTIVFVTLLTIITQRKHCAGKSLSLPQNICIVFHILLTCWLNL
uniref:Receptor tyrosine kinase n=1 Tax=Drosophila melanogaster TaxID=7227 RepID=Q9GP67_DROME|nr:receptor tyrosine kinase [Drosophila melanogaster]